MDKKQTAIQWLSTAILVMFLLVCGFLAHDHRQQLIASWQAATPTPPPNPTRPQASVSVPADYFQVATPSGQLQTFTYQTHDYTRPDREAITKTALVYLPPGYDNSGRTRYNIIYWLHGWQMTNQEFLTLGDHGTVHLLDHLINNGEMPPVIVVSLTFDRDNAPQDYDRSIAEMSVFDQEVCRDLLPALESVYPTYAEGTDEASLQAAREHRAFSGFSLGGVATWYEWERARDLFAYFVPMSADSWTITQNGGYEATLATAQRLSELAQKPPRDFLLIQTNGDQDTFYQQIDAMMIELMRRPEIFHERNLIYLKKKDGQHDMLAIWEMVYNAFPRLFVAKK